jgi:hypothetical protein
MNETHTQSVEFDVNLPKPGPRSILAKILVGVLVLGIIGGVAAVVISRTASPTVDPTMQVLPADTMMMLSLNPHPDQLSNYQVVADAWQGSKEAKQLESGLQLLIIQAGFNWEDDIQPWLGDRVTFGLVDLGNLAQPMARDANPDSKPQSPFFLLAAHTRDRAKSDAFLANVRKEIESKIKPSNYLTTTFHDDTYRGSPIVYLTTEIPAYGSTAPQTNDTFAYATVNDVIVVTTSPDHLKKAIDAALDGNNLPLSANYKTTMGALPNQTVFALYMDANRFMSGYLGLLTNMSASTAMYGDSRCGIMAQGNATPDPECVKQLEDAQHQQQQQLQQLGELMQAYGGMGMAMTYEPSGLRFDIAEQYDQSRLPDPWRALLGTAMSTPVNNQIFDSIPASSMMVMNGATAILKAMLDPDYLSMALANNPALRGVDIAQQLKNFEQLTGVNLKTDLLDLLDGEFAFTLSLKDPAKTGFSMPIDLALLLDSSDASRLSANLDKILQAVSASSQSGVKWQSLSGLPFSALTDTAGKPIMTYGVVNGRFVIGPTSDTLLAIQNAAQGSLANDAQFKEALSGLPANRLQTFYIQFKPLWDLLQTAGDNPTASAVLNYLRPFKYISIGSEVPDGTLTRGVMHVAIGK